MEKPHLKRAVLRGGVAKMCSQAANVLVRIGTLMLFARLLSPADFGLIGMVVAVTGVLGLLKDFGLSAATVQRVSISEAEISALFWLNILIGVVLWLLCMAAAPVMVWFYGEERLLRITFALSVGFLFTAASVQHNALLQRQMRFGALALIDVFALLSSTGIGIVMASLGFGYWALVGWSVALPVVTCVGVWIASGWLPQLPKRVVSVRPMLRFGGLVTLNMLVVQVAYNLDKILVGRFWGATVLGLYGRAYQLTSIANNNLLVAMGTVAFPALSRAQGQAHLETYFVKGYKLVITMALPVAVGCVLFAEDIVVVLLGPTWIEVAPMLRLLGPLIAIYSLIDPTGWLLYSLGRVERSLKIALVILPIVAIGYSVGLPYGANGVAAGFTTALALWVIPHLIWSTRETTLSAWKLLRVARTPAIASLIAAPLAFGAHAALAGIPPLPRLLIEGLVLSLTYIGAVLWAREERTFYFGLLQSLRAGSGEIDAPRPGPA
jgi:O-antigen/teichoic acid export membrane protein